MKSIAALALLFVLTGASDLKVLEQGRYACALPGDAAGPALQRMGEHDFVVTLGSSYRSAEGVGTYLLAGDELTFTSGPFKNQRFRRGENGLWRQVGEEGMAGRLSCNRSGPSL
ncbi:elongation factor P [Qipengyuania sp.]|uniref:elongation factor P n=1 Tax=Qipengyuania sp. TaxID=2004515 RepID=UPI0035C84400